MVKKLYSKSLFFQVLLLLISVLLPSSAIAAGSAGIEVGLDSARALGKGNAVVADPEDASTLVYNPAGLTELKGNQIAGNFTTIVPHVQYTSVTGRTEDSSREPIYIPAFFGALNTPNENLKIGVGVNAPFGLKDQYASDGSFKYTGISNSLKSIYYTVDAAYEVQPWISVAGGVSYADIQLKQVSKLNSGFINAAFGDPTGYPDANTELESDGYGVGWNMGVLLKPHEKYTLGFFYRSKIHATLNGEYNVDNIQGPFVLVPVFGGNSFRTDISTDVTLPDSAVIGLNYKATEKLDLEVDFGWTGWGKFDHFAFDYARSNAVLAAGNPSEHKFRDSYSLNLGASYKIDQNWSAMTGYGYYQRAALKTDYSNVFPDGDRHNACVGLQYSRDKYSIALAYAAQFVSETSIDNNVGAINGVSIDGDYESIYHVILLSFTYKFD